MHTIFKRFFYYLTVLFSFLFFAFIISSCTPPDVKETTNSQFFDLEGFLDNQIIQLDKKEITITKKTILQGQKDEQIFKKIDWKDEFAFFYASDINKRQLRDRYKIEKKPQEWIFKTEDEKLIVKEMKIIFNQNITSKSFKNVKEIVIVQKDKNNLYENDRTLIIKVKNGLLESYSIKGSEDVILNEKQGFLVEATVK
ncbi:hypothetical protein Fleli_3123 [Bernardetia litoralis DSM 6794]|uniref:Lipoprotein n=1 Tax=Bernardetia litoralis (strain ATCC 23117 / DSM 6794 / NBRC 15988 / NCIMB 1366 / Fx l1 / Sio-4) TaxID=880071 RepID=I4ANC7_BERLS|nr:hypothetical protein [Bernardetia litoralis]AFM05462.1 hypothetical protein Fleli_3123 [Bernardetia litoralis DSM 6794]